MRPTCWFPSSGVGLWAPTGNTLPASDLDGSTHNRSWSKGSFRRQRLQSQITPPGKPASTRRRENSIAGQLGRSIAAAAGVAPEVASQRLGVGRRTRCCRPHWISRLCARSSWPPHSLLDWPVSFRPKSRIFRAVGPSTRPKAIRCRRWVAAWLAPPTAAHQPANEAAGEG